MTVPPDAAAWETVETALDHWQSKDGEDRPEPDARVVVSAFARLKAAYEAMERERDGWKQQFLAEQSEADFYRKLSPTAKSLSERAEAADRERDEAKRTLWSERGLQLDLQTRAEAAERQLREISDRVINAAEEDPS